MNPKEAFSKLKEISTDSHVISDVSAIIGWDQEVNMPPKGLELSLIHISEPTRPY